MGDALAKQVGGVVSTPQEDADLCCTAEQGLEGCRPLEDPIGGQLQLADAETVAGVEGCLLLRSEGGRQLVEPVLAPLAQEGGVMRSAAA